MFFVPQRRAPFRHLDFKKCSERDLLLVIFFKCAFPTTGVQFFISHLARWLRTRHFSEHTLRPEQQTSTNHWKNSMNRDFPTFSRTRILFLLTLSLLWSSNFLSFPPGLFTPLLFHLCILSEVWLLNFLRWSPACYSLWFGGLLPCLRWRWRRHLPLSP